MKLRSVELSATVGHLSQLPTDGLPEIALAGRSNVGKSSLLNKLLNRRNLARVSNSPGKTRTLNFYRVNDLLYLVDLPGYGFAKRSPEERKQWGALVNGYVTDRESLKGIVQIVDSRHDPTADDLEMVRWLAYGDRPYLIVASKTDKLSNNQMNKQLPRAHRSIAEAAERTLEDTRIQPFSAVTGRGREDVWRWIGDTTHAGR
jgi:GTP-binding protein